MFPQSHHRRKTTSAHEFEVAEMVALILLLETILKHQSNQRQARQIFCIDAGEMHSCLRVLLALDSAKGVFIMPALHISTSSAGAAYEAANVATVDKSCGEKRKAGVT
jgi:hypothetical protein